VREFARVGCATTLAVALLAAVPATATAPLELHVLDCGTMDGIETDAFLSELPDPPAAFDMVNRCFLVVHPLGTLLWDVGFPRNASFTFMSWWLWLSSFGKSSVTMDRSVVEQLAELGYEPSDIDFLAVSHVHFDHIGEANEFADSTWIVQKAERDWAFSEDLDNPFVQPDLFEALAGAKTVELTGDHDVFGDGRVEILTSPGHTPGHQCLYLDLPETGPVVLSGDLYHSTLNREHRLPPNFNVDAEQTRSSMERIEALVSERGAQLWIQHSPDSGVQAPAVVR